MVNKDLNSNEKILVKVDQNNLIYVDPNSVISGGVVEPRNIEQEKLVMYVNLEADLIPRSYLLSDSSQTRYISIVNKTFNLLTPQNGTDLNTDWTESYNPEARENSNKDDVLFFNKSDFTDSSGQAFGIEKITIVTKGANFIPQINIEFIDVRGKTLFEQPSNSPYSAFFHLPWPIFYLTIKGYYGKAIRYRLHLVKFSSKYNADNGNFEISTSFIGSTYAYLNDIPLNGIINAPYLYANANETSKKFNSQKGIYEQELKKSSKGYLMLESVYSEMKQKGYLPKDFKTVTLREVEYLAMQLDKILEKTIFDQVIDPKILAKIEEYNKAVGEYVNSIKGWVTQNMGLYYDIYDENKYFFFLLQKDGLENTKLSNKNTPGTLEFIIQQNNEKISVIAKEINGLVINTSNTSNQSNTFKRIKPNYKIKILSTPNSLGDSPYYGKKTNNNRNTLEFGVKLEKLFSDLYEIENLFYEETSRVMKELEKQINVIVRTEGLGLGFDPTIKNIFAIIMANAEVYIRMLKDVHIRAFNAGNTRKSLLQPFDKETTKNDCIYPWPEVKKSIPGSRTQVIAYPGDFELRKTLKSTDKNIWPEVDFIEQYIKFVTKVTGVEKVDYFYSGNDEIKTLKKISTIFDTIITPYGNRVISSFLYEIFERAKQITLLDSFNSDTIQELADIEFENLKSILENDVDISTILKNQVKSIDDLLKLMESFSPFDKYPYYKDSIPTTTYISDILEAPFSIDKAPRKTNDEDLMSPKIDKGTYPNLETNLKNYTIENYRKYIFPFNSTTYLNYINSSNYHLNNFEYSKILSIETDLGFISSIADSSIWVNDFYKSNIFSQNLKIGKNNTNILNTPYFHKQLYYDLSYRPIYGRYAGSSYLLLNSLPFKELGDYIGNSNLRMASMFKEIGATHYIPYFLILKWGSIYHRYKTYLKNGIDILHGEEPSTDYGCLSLDGKTLPIDGEKFFKGDVLTGLTITISGQTQGNIDVSYNGKNTGLHPFYDALYHNIVNGYLHFNITQPEISYEQNVDSKKINCFNTVVNNMNQWTSYVDNSLYKSDDNHFTIMPSYGFNEPKSEITQELLDAYGVRTKDDYINYIRTNPKSFDDDYQSSFRVILEYENIINNFSGKTFAGYNEYIKNLNDEFSIDSNNKKVIDLIGTFSPDILDQFEQIFLDFVSEELNGQVSQYKFPDLSYNSFQSLLKDIVTVNNFTWTDVNDLRKKLYENQTKKLKTISDKIIGVDNLLKVKLGNPKELDSYYIEGFTQIAPQSTLTFNNYSSFQYTPENIDLIKLYIGEFPDDGINYYEEFFEKMDIELNESNIFNLRPLILIYAGYRKNGGSNSYSAFKRYVIDNIYGSTGNTVTPNGANRRLNIYLVQLINNFSQLNAIKDAEINVEFYGGFNDDGLKIELYNFFKSYNDKWASGNSIGQRLLFEDFLFLDKANRDIGDRGYINLDRFIELMNPKNSKQSLYGAISILLQGSGFDMRALPAYVNFYGKSLSTKAKILPSSTVAENIFGTFLDVDYEDSNPKMVIQYVEGPVSKHPDITSKNNRFMDDSFDISDTNNNPIMITDPSAFTVDNLLKSNRAVAFEVSFGDQNQSIFKGITLDQNTIKNTTESFGVLENLARSETGAGIYNVDTALYEYYRQASYSCEVSAMGNMMIQPTMFFYLKNVPMFKGSYWITEVNHKIDQNTISTTFKGTRIPRSSLPDPMDSFVASFRPIMDKVIRKALSSTKKPEMSGATTTEVTIISSDGKPYVTDLSGKSINGETIISEAGITEFGLPYNGWGGERNIQYIQYGNKKWFKAIACRMSVSEDNGVNVISDENDMVLLSGINNKVTIPDKVKWSELKSLRTTNHFYSSKFRLLYGNETSTMICNKTVKFVNPKNDKTVTVTPNYQLDRSLDENNKPIIPLNVTGAVDIGPSTNGYGIALSEKLMFDLGLLEGNIVYFEFI